MTLYNQINKHPRHIPDNRNFHIQRKFSATTEYYVKVLLNHDEQML